ncbi:hypothetical protein M9H77_34875 [Catharanthus roseus]|uniref:Uncharacterized protein n=1 Tax=Catharanthus roseus TaxID=4058 RepID=A0ACB9ZN63_CATRO|nr:hypothetical protein M9H77_34875 [Catharanthus roseus]
MDFDLKKSGQIPAFGNWEFANDLPITQYFECARQAGLLRHTSSLCECPPCVSARAAADFEKPPPPVRILAVPPPSRKTTRGNGGNKKTRRSSDVKEQQRKQAKVYDVKDQPTNQLLLSRKQFPKQVITQRQRPSSSASGSGSSGTINNVVKPVDEDLYKIPQELLHNSKRKKMLGFISRCLVPPCKA